MTDAIAISGLVKSYGATKALDGLDLSVAPGEVHGLLGPNGAGKTTTLRILLGLLRRDAGEVSVMGCDPWADAIDVHGRLAYVPGDVELWPNLSGGEAIDLLGRLRGGLDRARRDELLEHFDLDPTKKGRTYSKGNRQKVAIVAALASDAELLVLDEPTAGLDPLMEVVFQEVINRMKQEEETGRAELVRASRVGRHATVTAALVVAVAANLALGAVLALSLGALGVEGVGWGSSLLFGTALATVGIVFAAVAAMTAQVNEHARGASGLAGAVLALAYVLRAAGDMTEVGGGLLSWLSPIGWAQQTRVYVDDRWWPLLLPVG